MLAAAAWRKLTPALVLLLVVCATFVFGALEDTAVGNEGPAATGICQAPIELEPGVNSVHCTSPAIRMTPGQVCWNNTSKTKSCSQSSLDNGQLGGYLLSSAQSQRTCALSGAGYQHQFTIS